MRRRTFLASGGTVAGLGLAGCISQEGENGGTTGNGDDEDVLRVAANTSFVDAPSDSPGEWIADEFADRYDVEFEWQTPEQELNYYIERHNEDVEIEPELYLGLNPHEVVRADQNTDDELFVETDEDALEHVANVDEEHYFDPHGRVIPTYRSFCAMVYDGRNVDTPETFDDLLDPKYEGQIAVSNPQRGTTGLLFLLWTIDHFGEDEYLEYWDELLDNDTRVLDSWSEVYAQFEEGEVPVVASYANDRVYAQRADNDLEKHQVALLHDQAYANVAGMARFADGTNDDLAHEFMDFILDPEVQAVIAERNVTGPVNDETELPEVYEEYAKQPDDTPFFDYDDLEANLDGWLDEWEQVAAGDY
ncbi:thiamine-binding periplasmic protein -like protein [Natronococcus amylolyticus DSM 10524]|uniref:Thiamine-binding periplasmic protein-like protein n=1 Tax=Natronococcus amylolyticus DSM 10524 TaxID=1227497 RepID=L9X503_9EURY|nr:thiamine ABC transporter substrate-binding protein [Natronococcus amylolyticus]ELY56864.1 thiamine-binding periplasmic protein -like protein [Natronococcus amylolyticus DSM 10524]